MKHNLPRLFPLFITLATLHGGCTDPVLPTGSGGSGGTGGQPTGGAGGDTPLKLAFDDLPVDEAVDQVTDMAFVPGRDELIVLEKTGRVLHFDFDGTAATLKGSFEIPVYTGDDCGLISVAFPPDFATTNEMYLGYCADFFSSQVSRFTLAEPYTGILESEVEVIRLNEPNAAHPWHNVGSIGFEPSGVMWALFGEKTVGTNAQDLSKDLGKLLRIIPRKGQTGFDPAPDNPYAGDPTKSPNVFAYGLRSPWKGLRDSEGRFWVGDVGADTFEEVNYITKPGVNLGWPNHEGPCDASLNDGCTDPITSWGRSLSHPYPAEDPDAIPAGTRVVWVGPHIEPMENDPYGGRLDGITFFGDFVVGWIRGLRVDAGGAITLDQHLGHLNHAGAWARAPSGVVYAMTFGPLKVPDAAKLVAVRLED